MLLRRRGFTLIELIACLALLALAAGVVTLSLRGRTERAALLQGLDEVAHADRVARQMAAHTGKPLGIVFDLDRQVVLLQRRDSQAMRPRQIELPRGVRIEQVLTGRGRADSGQVQVPCSTRGQTPSFAVELSSGKQRQWRLVAGLTGENEDLEHAQDVEKTLQLCQVPGDDAD